ncbi:MAG: bifunctional demethylmenaquinone methyltransferase/2-methoxy-6-polyprenyl-1,4-benzoquinol methylase UbiE [Gammaproteobacteria bacterium]|uniref:Ubiquinone/menaquinone biosynthesis C-methyltransferase UbiE n=1 Tax=Candidatus Thiopontia autotrophica TaxID=2841688 RepID=A0A8J6P4P1_9GAMM|nr:bifunctional demethylmenaquinone methyltransferase/2-methoxy-6-polyprenyl-1,4-benzoquinol methylase UbiE [Candidatus Thiopontia autotrophica]MBL6969014.1 bifunctional demethylmenaquinone methyltransferase/2-methoxy-6-polyprenyl-1,4-benzoquinol methylase UbiE [Gammaproteobacteria bacterium]
MSDKGEQLSQTFGYSRVDEQEREKKIRAVFQAVAPRYDLMNDMMSFGIHRLWKRRLVKMVNPQSAELIVDLAGGTGDIAEKMAAEGRTVVVIDPSEAMMAEGKRRGIRGVEFRVGTGESIPLPDSSVDRLTISFGIRNMTNMGQALSEINRVLKPGGKMYCLEFSRPHWLIKPFYDLHSFYLIPRLGAWVAKAPIAYNYLVESIRRFPDQEEMKRMMEQAGFTNVSYRNLTFGIAAIHTGEK